MKKDRRRLVLNGSDDAYARREAVKDGGSTAEDGAGFHREPVRAKAAQQREPASRSEREPVTGDERPGEQSRGGSTPPAKQSVQGIQVNYRLNLGEELSERLQYLADTHDQSIKLLMKGLRGKATERFREVATAAAKPRISVPATGGKSIRYATSISGDMAETLNAWFDPFGLGVAKDACKPILIWLFQEEATTLCDAVEGVGADAE